MKKYLFIALLLSACGEEGSPRVTEPIVATDDGFSFTGEELQTKWKALCIDNNLPAVEAHYQQCLWIYTINPPCDQNKVSNIALLNSTWTEISEMAMANYHHCLTEGLGSVSFCQGNYEKEIAFRVDLVCEEYATKY